MSLKRLNNLSGFQRCLGVVRFFGASAEGVTETSVLGPVAQLGERLVCIQEVVGSNPVGSTSLPGGRIEGL